MKNNQNTTVRANLAQNSSFLASVIIPKIVVSELISTGLNLVEPALRIANFRGSHAARLVLILSIIKMALFTTIPIKEMNQIINGIL